MKIGIITHYDVHNHGAILQLNAFVKILAGKNIESYALQFEKNYDFIGHALKSKYNIGMHSIPIYMKYLQQQGVKKTAFNVKKKQLLEGFKKVHKLVGDYYAESPDLDAVCIGSDEVFALHTGPTPAFFGYALPSDYVFSYAASFGPTVLEDINTRHCSSFVKYGIGGLQEISVRDKNSKDIIEQLTGRIPQLVCDPVLLYGYGPEMRENVPVDLDNFLLIYAYDSNMNNDAEVQKIRDFAKRENLTVASVGFYHKWCDRNINVDPVQLLHYFKKAKHVVTDTFHGSVLSIVTNSNFAVIPRNNSNKLLNLLTEYGLTDRIVHARDSLPDILNNAIRFEAVNEELARRRAESMSFLEKCISDSISINKK